MSEQPAIWFVLPPPSSTVPVAPPRPVREPVTLSVDGEDVSIETGATVLDACRQVGTAIPTLC